MSFTVEMSCSFSLEMGHFMPNFPEGHPNRRMHGHSYQGILYLVGPVDISSGVLVELSVLQSQIQSVVNEFDHRLMNEIEGLEFPTTENLARVIFRKFKDKIQYVDRVELIRPTLGMKIVYRGANEL